MNRTASNPRAFGAYVGTILLDVVAVVVFAATGRSSHEEGLNASGIAATAWPFLAGAAIGWAIYLLIRARQPWKVWPAGVIIWVSTVVAGMILRVTCTDKTAQFSFIIVATIATAVLLLGWRALARLVTR